MKVLIEFKKYNIENGFKEQETSFCVPGIFQDSILKFVDNDKAINLISIKDNEITVERKSEIKTHMVLKKGEKTKFVMVASFGNLELDLFTNILNVKKDSVYILYNVLEDFNSYKTYELHITFSPVK